MSQNEWMAACKKALAGHRRMIDAAVGQLNDEQFFARPAPGFNSVANLLRHLGGNLNSRWTHFLTEDGEKPDRDRDREFEDWTGSRPSLMEYFDDGWRQLIGTLDRLTEEQLSREVYIRGEPHSVPFAIQRSINHVAYHLGQLVAIRRALGAWPED